MRVFALLMVACAPEDIDPQDLLPVDEAPPPFTLSVTDPVLGGSMTMSVVGANANEQVQILRSPAGPGSGPCLPQIGGRCLDIRDPVAWHAAVTVNGAGEGSRSMSIPSVPALDGQPICFQAAIIRGTGGAQSVISNVACATMGYDSDGDGVINQRDVCASGDDWFDWDQDGTPDSCDVPADRPPVFTDANPIVPWQRGSFQGRAVVWYIPPSATGLAFIFHGSGGDASVADSPETIVILNELLQRGIGFVAIGSDNRTQKTWTTDVRASQNPDFARLSAWRQDRIAAGQISTSTPIFAWGFSNGGAMASYLTHAAPAAGWNFGAAALQAHGGYTQQFGDPASEPVLFIAGRWDTSVTPSDIEANYNDHVGRGRPGQYRLIPEQRLAPTRFDRSEHIRADRSLSLFRTLVDTGYFDKGGRRQFAGAQIDATIDEIGRRSDISPSAPTKAVLNAVLATHAINGYYAEQIAAWFDAYN